MMECNICYEEKELKKFPTLNKMCKHEFCQDCISKTKKSCPYCRSEKAKQCSKCLNLHDSIGDLTMNMIEYHDICFNCATEIIDTVYEVIFDNPYMESLESEFTTLYEAYEYAKLMLECTDEEDLNESEISVIFAVPHYYYRFVREWSLKKGEYSYNELKNMFNKKKYIIN